MSGHSMLPSTNMRLIWFAHDVQPDIVPHHFSQLFGEEPDRSTRVKQVSPQSPFLATAGGKVSGFDVELQLQVGRLDLLVTPNGSGGSGASSAPPVMESMPAIDFLKSAINQTNLLPISQRLSWVVTASYFTKTIDEAEASFEKYLGLELNLPDATDHNFQVNRRSLEQGVSFNRVLQVAVLEYQNIELAIASGIQRQTILTSWPALSITQDFNTVPDGSLYDIERQKLSFNILAKNHISALERNSIDFLRG